MDKYLSIYQLKQVFFILQESFIHFIYKRDMPQKEKPPEMPEFSRKLLLYYFS